MPNAPQNDLSYVHRDLTPLINREVIAPGLNDGSLREGQALAMPSRTTPETTAMSLVAAANSAETQGTTILQPIAFRFDGDNLVTYSRHPEITAHAALLVFENTDIPRITYIDSEGFPLPFEYKKELSEKFPGVEIQEVTLKQQEQGSPDCCPHVVRNAKAVVDAIGRGEEISESIFTVPAPGEMEAQRAADAPFLEQIKKEKDAYKRPKDVPMPGYQPRTLKEHIFPESNNAYGAKVLVAKSAQTYKKYFGKEPESAFARIFAMFMHSTLGILTEIEHKAYGVSAPGHLNYHHDKLTAGNTDFSARLDASQVGLVKGKEVKSSAKLTTPSLLKNYRDYFFPKLKPSYKELVGDAAPAAPKDNTPRPKYNPSGERDASKFIPDAVKEQALLVAEGAKTRPSAPPLQPEPSAPPASPSLLRPAPSAPPIISR